MRFKGLVVSLLLPLLLGAAKYDTTLSTKASGSKNLVALGSATVNVYKPGATASAAATSPSTTVNVYNMGSPTSIQVGDTVEVNGFTATVLTVPSATQFTISTSLTWAKGDRFLRTSQAVTLYNDPGAVETLAQPVTASTVGRVIFFVDTITNPSFDLKAVSSDGLRYVEYGILLLEGGTGTTAWTDDGTVIRVTTATDDVRIGSAAADGRVTETCPDTQLITAANPTSCYRMKGDTNSTDWAWWVTSDKTMVLSDGLENTLVAYDTGTSNHMLVGDVDAIALPNKASLQVRPQLATERAITATCHATQSVPCFDVVNSADVNQFSVTAAGVVTAAGAISSSSTISGTAISGTTGTFSSTLQGTALVVPGTTTINTQAYTWPASQTANTFLKTNGSGTLSWADPNANVCNAIASKYVTATNATCGTSSTHRARVFGSDLTFTVGCASDETTVFDRLPAAMVAKKLFVTSPTQAATVSGCQIVVQKNGSDGALTCTIASAGNGCSDTSNTMTYAAGDTVSMKLVRTVSGGAGSCDLKVAFCLADIP